MKRDQGIGEISNAGRKVGVGVKPTGVFARIAAAQRKSGEKKIIRHTIADSK